ncbi:hypothetical protein Lal_00047820 [Lupinus albus]|nr:hypothetical protein Lal_00047820 [Lupinus albus]
MEQYRNYTNHATSNMFGEEHVQLTNQLKFDSASLAEKIELLDLSKRKMLGHSLSCCSYDELQGIENQLHTSLESIRLKKAELYKEHIEKLHSQERDLLKENAELNASCVEKSSQKQWARQTEAEETAPRSPRTNTLGVETQLFIGLPYHPS